MEAQEIVQDQTSINQTLPESSSPSPVEPESAEAAPEKSLKEKIGEVAAAAKGAKTAQDPTKVVAPQFVPNYKFKALDKEHEIPESLRAAIKDADTEKQVRELMLKAIGMDHIKPKYQETRQKYEEVNTAYQGITKQISDLRADYQKGDMASFFEKLQIPEEKILQYAVQLVQNKELPPEQQQMLAARRDAEKRAQQLEVQNYQLSEQTMAHAVEAKRWQLDTVMQRPDVSNYAEAYDKARGKPGSFRDVVIRTGEAAFHTRQKDISPEEAIKEAMDMLGGAYRAQQAMAEPVQQQVQQPVAKKPVVIPNVQGRSSTSPTKKQLTSLDDLRKFAKDKYAPTK